MERGQGADGDRLCLDKAERLVGFEPKLSVVLNL